MLSLNRLDIKNFRNITHAQLELNTTFNIFCGDNGSGKTSILEAIYMLGLNRSFRTRNIQRIIQNNYESLTVFGLITRLGCVPTPIGVEKHRSGKNRLRINQHDIDQVAELAELLPLQIITPDSHRLLDAGPKYRRQFIDWGLFHVEHSFFPLWRKLNRILLQRNAVLKQRFCLEHIKLWDIELIPIVECINNLRKNYVSKLSTLFAPILANFGLTGIYLFYKQGWSEQCEFPEALAISLSKDIELGYTQYGPHRSDLTICSDKIAANDVLSRGQQKIVMYALCLAQGLLLQQETSKTCVYLLDDLASELDETLCNKMIDYLITFNSQTFVTGVSSAHLKHFFAAGPNLAQMFHVEHGSISLV